MFKTSLFTLALLTAAAPVAAEPPTFVRIGGDLFAKPGALANAWADFDGDGDPDLAIGYVDGVVRLFRNDGGAFAEADAAVQPPKADGPVRSLAWGDFDADGYPDLYVGTAKTPIASRNLLLRNLSGKGFAEVGGKMGVDLPGANSRQSSWIDYDNDGDLDLFVTHRSGVNRLFRNDGGRFADIGAAVGLADIRRTVAACWFDFDKDGDLDLYVGNQAGDRDGFYRNDNGRFTDIAKALGIDHGDRNAEDGAAGCSVADYDNDGDLDLFVGAYGQNILYRNQGGRFTDVAAAVGMTRNEHLVGSDWGDFDLDGRIDLYVAGFRGGRLRVPDHFYRNTSTGFVDVQPPNMAQDDGDHGVQWADIDQDGDLDLALTNSIVAGGGGAPLYRNELGRAKDRRALLVSVLDAQGHATQAGAEVRVFSRTGTLLATRIVETATGYGSQNVLPVHFGLAGSGRVDVEVAYMSADGRKTQRLANIDPNAFVRTPLIIRRSVPQVASPPVTEKASGPEG